MGEEVVRLGQSVGAGYEEPQSGSIIPAISVGRRRLDYLEKSRLHRHQAQSVASENLGEDIIRKVQRH